MIASLPYVEHWRDRSKAKQTMQSKFFKSVVSTDLQTPTSSGMADQLATGSCRSKEKGRNMRRKNSQKKELSATYAWRQM